MRHRLSVEQPSASCARGASLTNQIAKTILHQNVPREHILFCGRVGSLGAVGEGGALLIERFSFVVLRRQHKNRSRWFPGNDNLNQINKIDRGVGWEPLVITSTNVRLDLKWTSRTRDVEQNRVQVFETSGGPAQTRTGDLYRVKVKRSTTYRHPSRVFIDLQPNDLDSFGRQTTSFWAFGLHVDSGTVGGGPTGRRAEWNGEGGREQGVLGRRLLRCDRDKLFAGGSFPRGS
jgi:hypothetical protein